MIEANNRAYDFVGAGVLMKTEKNQKSWKIDYQWWGSPFADTAL